MESKSASETTKIYMLKKSFPNTFFLPETEQKSKIDQSEETYSTI